MKKLSALAFVFVFMSLPLFAQTACESCREILKEGLYRTVISTRTTSFSQDLKIYFQSEQFKSDLKTGKWGAKVDVVVEGVPLGLGANASDTQFSEFVSKVKTATSLQLTQSTFDQLKTAIPDAEIARI